MSVNAVSAKPARAAQKGQQTKAVIVDAALALAAQIGLEGLSIGAVAEITKMDSGCIYISGASEFDDRPGPVRDALVESVSIWQAAVLRAIVQSKEEGHLNADADERQVAFEIHGLILALHYEARFLRVPGSIGRANTGFDNILGRYAAAGTPAPTTSAAAPSRVRRLKTVR